MCLPSSLCGADALVRARPPGRAPVCLSYSPPIRHPAPFRDGMPSRSLGVHLHARRVPQHRAAVQHVYRELLRQRVRLVAHHHPHPEVAQFRVLRDGARPWQRLRQPPHHQSDGVLRERHIVRRHRTAPRLLHELRPEYEEVLDLPHVAVNQRPQSGVARRLELAEPRYLPPRRVRSRVHHHVLLIDNHELSFIGQESKDFTYRLCRMNLFIHGLDGKIELGNSYFTDLLANVKADYLLANPPFNDGSKGENGWGAERVPAKDPRLQLGDRRVTLSPRSANTMWILHFLYHLKSTGTAGFVMATGELSNGETARREVRQTLVDADFVDCIVQLSGQLFANTQIPCALWFLSKNRSGTGGFRRRKGEILFLDGRKLGSLIPGSRKPKELASEAEERMAAVYRTFKRTGIPEAVPGFCRVATLEEVRTHGYALTPGRYVGSPESDEDEEPFEEKMPRLVAELEKQFVEASGLEAAIRTSLSKAGYAI